MTFISKATARDLRIRACGLLITRFLATRPGAVRLRSKEPAVAWNTAGLAAFLVIEIRLTPEQKTSPRWGPPPLLLRVDINGCPPPGLRYALNDSDFRQRLGLVGGPASSPSLELVFVPEEAEQLGEWLPSWYNSAASPLDTDPRLAPPSPVPLDGEGLSGPVAWSLAAADQLRYWYSTERVK